MRQLLFLVLLLGAVTSACAQGAAVPGPEGMALSLWQPSQSYPGGAQADPRLDQPVKFWRAGLMLSEVFAAVKEQTSVELGFWPPEDQNTRVRVNLYLNQDEPPSLRELMAQLMWVTDCTFAYERIPEAAGPSYCLLRTSVGEGLEQAIPRTKQDRQENQERREREEGEAQEEQNLSRLEQLIESLGLPRDELVDSYRDSDDCLLYSMLDPRPRTILEFLQGYPKERRRALIQDGTPFRLDWSSLSSDQQEFWRNALHIHPSWFQQDSVRLDIYYTPQTVVAYAVPIADDGKELSKGHRPTSVSVPLCPPLDASQQVALWRLMGEKISQADEEDYYRKTELAEQADTRARAEARAARAPKALLSLSPEATERLSGVVIPAGARRPRLLWQLQEAVAATTCMNVVSDCFVDLARFDVRSGSEGLTEITALGALTAACRPDVSRDEYLVRGPSTETVQDALGWEWGDAGSFLRFRSCLRDLWRASMLPQDVLKRLASWQVAMPATTGAAPADRTTGMRIDIKEVGQLAKRLSDLQVTYGGYQAYGNPADEGELCAMEVRRRALVIASNPFIRAVSTLGLRQWDELENGGMPGGDLSPDQRALLMQDPPVAKLVGSGAEAWRSLRLRLVSMPRKDDIGIVAARDHAFQLLRGERVEFERRLPGALWITPPAKLTPFTEATPPSN